MTEIALAYCQRWQRTQLYCVSRGAYETVTALGASVLDETRHECITKVPFWSGIGTCPNAVTGK